MKELNCLVGDKLPKFKAGALNGDILSNKNLLSSEFNLFNFWFIGCPPCIEELDELNELKQRSNLSILSF